MADDHDEQPEVEGQRLHGGDVGGRGTRQERADRLDGRGVGRARLDEGQPQQLHSGAVLLKEREPSGQVGGGGELQYGRQVVGQLVAVELRSGGRVAAR